MMKARCGVATDVYDRWRARATGGEALDPIDREVLETFVEPSIGLPGDPRSLDHLEGAVAEFIWYLAALARPPAGRQIRHIEKPSLLASEPGGDGLVIYEMAADQSLIFRLWEVKKHTGGGGVSPVIRRACLQLSGRGKRYFAKYASQGEYLPDQDLVALYAQLGERWIRSDRSAGAGVAIATSESNTPTRAFSRMYTHFPQFSSGDQLEGLVAGIGDFGQFAQQVRTVLWSGL
jgi:hypothetical protein